MRLNAPDAAVVEIDAPSGRRYRARRGVFQVDDPADARAMQAIGAFQRTGVVRGRAGYRCGCGHLSWFRDRCGRCGATSLTREEP